MWLRRNRWSFKPTGPWWTRSFVRIPLIYLLLAGGYIAASSLFFAGRLDYSAPILETELLKGLIFVVVTSGVLALLLFRMDLTARASQTSFHDLIQSLPDAVLVISVPDRRIVFVNDACAGIFGYRSDELIDQSTEILHIDQAHFARFHELTATAFEQGSAHVGEFRLRRRDGSAFPTSHIVTLLTNEQQTQRYVVSIVRDESEAFEQRQKARESLEQLRILANNLEDVFWVADAAGKIEFLSQAFENIWGRSVGEMLEDPSIVLEQVHPEDRELVRKAIEHAADGYDIRYRMIRPDGDMRWIRGRAVPVKGENGSTERIVGISTDITQLVQHQVQLRFAQKLRAVGELTGGVAHDFNNLLMIMMGNAEEAAERLRARGIDEPALEEIVAAGYRARDLTQSLLRFSRHETQDSSRLDLNAAVARTATMLDRLLGRRISVATALADEDCIVKANPTEFETCLMNLMINARDAMPRGGQVTVSSRIEQLAAGATDLAPGEYVVLAVADTGEGMSESVRERALEPFFTTKQSGSGSGLGLSLVNSFCKSAGGTIRLLSRPGEGTIVEIYLPCWPGQSAAGSEDVDKDQAISA